MLQMNPSLQVVKLSGNSLDKTIDQVLKNLARLPELEHLDLSGNNFQVCNQALPSLGDMMEKCTQLKTLLLNRTGVVSKLNAYFFDAVTKSKTLEHLGLNTDKVCTHKQAVSLAQAFAANRTSGGSLVSFSLQGFMADATCMQDFSRTLASIVLPEDDNVSMQSQSSNTEMHP